MAAINEEEYLPAIYAGCRKKNKRHWIVLYCDVRMELFKSRENNGKVVFHAAKIPDPSEFVKKWNLAYQGVTDETLEMALCMGDKLIRGWGDYKYITANCQLFACNLAKALLTTGDKVTVSAQSPHLYSEASATRVNMSTICENIKKYDARFGQKSRADAYKRMLPRSIKDIEAMYDDNEQTAVNNDNDDKEEESKFEFNTNVTQNGQTSETTQVTEAGATQTVNADTQTAQQAQAAGNGGAGIIETGWNIVYAIGAGWNAMKRAYSEPRQSHNNNNINNNNNNNTATRP